MSTPIAPSVAFAWLYTAWGGAEIQLLHLARHSPAGTQITVIAPRSTDGTLRALWSDVPHRWIDVDHHIAVTDQALWGRGGVTIGGLMARIRRGIDSFRAGRDLRRTLSTLPADVVVHLDIPPWSAFVALASVARQRPVVLTWHTPMPAASSLRARLATGKMKLLGRMRGLHVSAANEAARIDAARVFGRDRSDIVVIPAGFDPDEIAAGEADERHDLVVGVGAVIDRKGVDVAVEALRHLHQRGHTVSLIWFGEGEQRRELERSVGRLELGSAIEIRPPAPSSMHRIDMLRTVARAAVYVQPSRVEGLPVAVIEAMALGRPVVATKVGAMSELGDEGGITWIPVDDADALAESILALLTDPQRRHVLGRRGREFVEGRYDMRRVAPAVYDHYARLSARRPDRRRGSAS